MRRGVKGTGFAACALALLFLSSCITRIPDEVLDADWCRSMEDALEKADARGRRNLMAAMDRHRCGEKRAAARAG